MISEVIKQSGDKTKSDPREAGMSLILLIFPLRCLEAFPIKAGALNISNEFLIHKK